MNKINIIVINAGVLETNELFSGYDRAKCIAKSEKRFLELCKEYDSHFDTYTQEKINDILDDGYHETGDTTISISWPELRDCDRY